LQCVLKSLLKQLYINYANQSSDFLSFNINIKDIASDPTIDSKEKVDRINAQFQAYINKVDQNLNLSAAQKEEYIKDVRLVVDQTIMLIQNPTVQKPSPFDLFKR
jgi:hypothetical protein